MVPCNRAGNRRTGGATCRSRASPCSLVILDARLGVPLARFAILSNQSRRRGTGWQFAGSQLTTRCAASPLVQVTAIERLEGSEREGGGRIHRHAARAAVERRRARAAHRHWQLMRFWHAQLAKRDAAAACDAGDDTSTATPSIVSKLAESITCVGCGAFSSCGE